MSKHTPAAWTPDEIRQMQEDWRRTDHNLNQVAELHACDRADVIMALGLTVADIKRSKKARRDLPRWETVNPEKAAEFVRLLEGGSTLTAACAAVGIKNKNTGYVIYKRIKERNALMSNEEKNVTAVAQAIQPPAADQPEPVRPEDYTVDKPAKSKKTARALADALDGMDTLVNLLNRKKLLSADEVEVCDRVMALADAFRVGIEYGEALKNA